jgi:glycosyltransferase involved in cell wall biosynthesis
MSPTARICLDLRVVQKASRFAGTGVYATSLGQALRDAGADLDLRYLVLRGQPLPWEIPPRQLLAVSRPARPQSMQEVFDPFDVPSLLRREGVSLLHSTVPGTVTPGRGLSVVVTVHDIIPDLIPREFQASLPARWLYRARMRCAARATHVITNSETTRRDLAERYGVSADRATTVHLGSQFPSGDGASARRAAPRRWHRPYLLYLGGFTYRKNVPALLAAFALVAGEFPEVDLVVAGNPGSQHTGELRRRVEELGLGARVGWLGHVATDDLPCLYAWSEGFVYPSLYEGFGLPVLEAMQFGAPVVSSDRGSIPEVMGRAGLAVDPTRPGAIAEGMRAVLSEPATRERLREAGPRQAARFSWNRCAAETLAVYQRVLAAAAPRPTGVTR